MELTAIGIDRPARVEPVPPDGRKIVPGMVVQFVDDETHKVLGFGVAFDAVWSLAMPGLARVPGVEFDLVRIMPALPAAAGGRA